MISRKSDLPVNWNFEPLYRGITPIDEYQYFNDRDWQPRPRSRGDVTPPPIKFYRGSINPDFNPDLERKLRRIINDPDFSKRDFSKEIKDGEPVIIFLDPERMRKIRKDFSDNEISIPRK